jgi:hypothetical protein
MKTTITKHQRLELIGLLALAEKHMNALDDINEAAQELTGDTEDGGHVCDAIFDSSRRDADALLKRLDIKVKN